MSTGFPCGPSPLNFALARYQPDGSLDPSFGSGGEVYANASIRGKNLTGLGINFDAGAVILLNGVPQNTISDSAKPGTTLIGVKVGRLIRPGDSMKLCCSGSLIRFSRISHWDFSTRGLQQLNRSLGKFPQVH